MFTSVPVRLTTIWQNQNLTLETGLLAKQATASVLATLGETSVLATVVLGKETSQDWLPLQVIYEERLYASGKIKGSRFIKREGRPTDNAVLTGRMVDRSIRSLFNNNIRQEIQVVITVLSLDEVNSPDVLAVLAASSALSLCGLVEQDNKEKVAFMGPISAVRIGIAKMVSTTITDPASTDSLKLVANPNYSEIENSDLDLVVSGNGKNIVMIEAGANIIDEETMLQAIQLAETELAILNNFQAQFIVSAKPKTLSVKVKNISTESAQYWGSRKQLLESVLYSTKDKTIRAQAIKEVIQFSKAVLQFQKVNAEVVDPENTVELPELGLGFWTAYTKQEWFHFFAVESDQIDKLTSLTNDIETAAEETITEIVKDAVLNEEKRLDGRTLDEIRPISTQIEVLPRTHGSSLFNRGETQVLNILTLGTKQDAQVLDDMEDFEESTKRYIHHYNFPPYSVGETGRYSGPGRREIGHGALAEKALLPVLPDEADFPYTMRLVSECLGSNGSTSMASTCASSLSLMEGGVPIKAAVGGIAMGLVISTDKTKFKILTDIQGAEDHYGDMDFKVTGTSTGITALQLDNKVAGLTLEVLTEALLKAKIGRLFILGKMEESIKQPKAELSQYAPRVVTVQVPVEKIGEVIGPSGKIVKSIIAQTGTTIDIDDKTGMVYIYGKEVEKVELARKIISSLVKEFKPGDIVSGEVFRIEAYGAFVKIDGTEKEGLIHISQISKDRVANVQDILKMGQIVQAKVIEINERGQISLSMKELTK